MATLTERLVHQIDRLHSKDKMLYISLDEGANDNYVVRLYDDDSGHGLRYKITGCGMELVPSELTRYSTSLKSWEQLAGDIQEGVRVLSKEGYNITMILNAPEKEGKSASKIRN